MAIDGEELTVILRDLESFKSSKSEIELRISALEAQLEEINFRQLNGAISNGSYALVRSSVDSGYGHELRKPPPPPHLLVCSTRILTWMNSITTTPCSPKVLWLHDLLDFWIDLYALVVACFLPSKFAITFTLGNLLSLGSTGFLIGPKRQVTMMLDPVCIYATSIYLASIIISLFCALYAHNKILLTLLAIILKFNALIWDDMGKTMLAQLIFNKDEVKSGFNPRIWVCMARHSDDGEDKDIKVAIVKRMLRYLGVEKAIVKSVCDAKPGLEGLLCALYLQLLGKRYLIVLDDATETDSWYKELDSSLTHGKKWGDSFTFGFPKGSGGRAIVTSRNEEIANMMVGKENVRLLEPMLDTESCWAIFKDSVDDDLLPTVPSTLKELKSEIKQKCGGLPTGFFPCGAQSYTLLILFQL